MGGRDGIGGESAMIYNWKKWFSIVLRLYVGRVKMLTKHGQQK